MNISKHPILYSIYNACIANEVFPASEKQTAQAILLGDIGNEVEKLVDSLAQLTAEAKKLRAAAEAAKVREGKLRGALETALMEIENVWNNSMVVPAARKMAIDGALNTLRKALAVEGGALVAAHGGDYQ